MNLLLAAALSRTYHIARVYKIKGYLTQRRQHGFSIVSTILMLDTNAGTLI